MRWITPERKSSVERKAQPQVSAGEQVWIRAGMLRIPALVVRMDGSQTVLVPLEDPAELQSLPPGMKLKVEDSDGAVSTIAAEVGSVFAIIGTPEAAGSRENRRRYFRIKPQMNVGITLDGASWQPGQVLDLSEGGLLAMVSDCPPLEVGDSITLRLRVSEASSIRPEGVVKRLHGAPGSRFTHVATEFTDLSEQERRLLVQFIFQHQTKMVRPQ